MLIKKYSIIFTLLILIASFGSLSSQSRDVIKTHNDSSELKAERLAIVVGVSEYLNRGFRKLDYTVSDADDMAKSLEENGLFTIIKITDQTELKPTWSNINSALDDAVELSELGMLKTFVFYFAGHGLVDNGVNYIAPMDADKDRIDVTTISMNDVINKTKHMKETKTMLLLDACRSPAKGERGGEDGWTDMGDTGLSILYSSEQNEPSYEDPQFEHGVYTYYLLEALEGNADIKPYGNEDGYVSFYESYMYLAGKMLEWSNINTIDGKQKPRMTLFEAGEFFLTKSSIEAPSRSIEDKKSGLAIFYGTSPGEFSFETAELKHGVFAYFLAESIKKADDSTFGDSNGYVEFSEIVKYTTFKTKQYSTKKGFEQTPSLSTFEFNDSIVSSNIPENRLKTFAGKRYAFFIGINEYKRLPDLTYCAQDSRLLKNIFVEFGNYVGKNLIDGDATKENIKKQIKDIEIMVNEGFINSLVIYFTGHAFSINNENYIVLHDTTLENNEKLKESSINWKEEIMPIINRIKDKCEVMIYLDICRNEINDGK
jgi:uncharacterized caspase-like protein